MNIENHFAGLPGLPVPCRLCGAPLEHTFADLGVSPPCQSFLRPDQLDEMEAFYPLHALVCGECFLVQLKEYVTPDSIFREYAYFSSYSTSWVAHAKAYCEMIASRLGLGRDSLVVEIACNDGYLLQHFLPMGIPVLGIEPALNVGQAAREKGIEVCDEFFGRKLAAQLKQQGREADLIVGNNVLAHVPALNDFVSGLTHLLKPEGVATFEFPHLERLIDENQFDTIYHEHFSYFSFLTVDRLAKKHGLKLIDVEELPTHGGSLRIYLAHAASHHPVAPSVPRLLERERRAGFETLETYTSFGQQVIRTKHNLLSFLIEAKAAGRRICGYGAPGKGNTLLNYCGIGTDFLDFVVDRNTYKQGLYTPGMRIPIRPVEAIDEHRPDLILILPWNLKTEIVEQMSHVREWGAQFIVPIPEVRILAAEPARKIA
jgi:SAM-dependent methyltransferase